MQYRESRLILDTPLNKDSVGFLHARAKIARIGIQKYFIDGKLVRELRRPEEIKASANEFENKPLTLDHPPESVNSLNSSRYMKGFVNGVDYEDGWIKADIHITDEAAIGAAETTHRQFSNGYYAEIKDESGLWTDDLGVMGEVGKVYEYDSVQTNIVGNHVALVTRARAGNNATFVADGLDEDTIILDSETNTINKEPKFESDSMNYKLQFNNMELVTDSKESKEFYDAMKAEMDALVSQLDSMKGKLADAMSGKEEAEAVKEAKDSLQGKVDALTAELEAAKAQPKMDAEVIATEVKERAAIWALVGSRIDSEADYSLTVDDVKKLYLKKELPNLAEKIDAGEASYIQGLWDIKKPSTKEDKADEQLNEMTAKTPGTIKIADNDDVAKLEAEYQAARLNYYK